MVQTGTTTRRHVIEVVVIGDAGLNRFTQAAERAGAKLQTLNRQARTGGGAFDKWGRSLQNIGYQVGDFAVQVASGTAAARAFAQQAPQALGAFGVWGAVIGAAVAVLAALGPALSQLVGDTTAAGDALGSFAPVVQGITDAFVALGSVAGDVLGVVVENLDRLLYYATAAAVVIGIRMTAAFVTSGRAATVFATAIGTARTALIGLVRVAPQLLAALALGEVAHRFSVLVENVGSVGEAIKILREIAVEFAQGFIDAFKAVPLELESIWDSIKSAFLAMLAYLQEKWADFIRGLADSAIDLATIEVFGGEIEIPGLDAAGQKLTDFADNAEANAARTRVAQAEASTAAATGWQAAQDAIAAGEARMTGAWNQLIKLTTEASTGQQDLARNITATGEAAAGAADEVTKANDVLVTTTHELSDQAAIIEGSFKTAFQSLIDGSKSAADAFGDMILSILQDITTLLVSSQLQQLLLALSKLSGFGWLGTTTTTITPPSVGSLAFPAVQGLGAPQLRSEDPGLGTTRAYVIPAPVRQTNPGVTEAGLNVNIYNETRAEVTATEGRDPLGRRTLEVLITDQVNQAIRSGAMDQTLGQTYGLRRRAR